MRFELPPVNSVIRPSRSTPDGPDHIFVRAVETPSVRRMRYHVLDQRDPETPAAGTGCS
jgi:hypothetical protein